MNTAPAAVIKASASLAVERNRTTKTRAVFRKLSLKAAKNWHQKSGAKRLETRRGCCMLAHYCKVRHVARGTKKGGLTAAFCNAPGTSATAGPSPRRIPRPLRQTQSRGQCQSRRKTA